MIILSVESSCDETAVALVEDGRRVLTDQIFSQADLHAIYGGVVPEIAARSHLEVISRLATRALDAAWAEAQHLALAFLTLEVRASNAPAIALYQKHGYAQVGLRRGYYAHPKEDAILMTRFT